LIFPSFVPVSDRFLFNPFYLMIKQNGAVLRTAPLEIKISVKWWALTQNIHSFPARGLRPGTEAHGSGADRLCLAG
jgi:hypothetical protein